MITIDRALELARDYLRARHEGRGRLDPNISDLDGEVVFAALDLEYRWSGRLMWLIRFDKNSRNPDSGIDGGDIVLVVDAETGEVHFN